MLAYAQNWSAYFKDRYYKEIKAVKFYFILSLNKAGNRK